MIHPFDPKPYCKKDGSKTSYKQIEISNGKKSLMLENISRVLANVN